MAFQPCANPECEYAANGDPEVSIEFCCEKCEGRFNGEEWASGGKKKHTAYCTSKQENAYAGGCGARVWGQCEHPECTYMAHSDPSVTTTGLYCCEKCEGLHQGADWAEGGKRHYKTCEKIEASTMASMNGYGKAPSFGKGSSKIGGGGFGPYAMMMQMLNQHGKGVGKAKGFGKGEGKSKKSPGSQFPASQRVWVGGIPEGTTRDELKAHFEVVGEPKFVFIRGTTGWVAFETDIEATTAIDALNGSIFGETMLEVDVWSGK